MRTALIAAAALCLLAGPVQSQQVYQPPGAPPVSSGTCTPADTSGAALTFASAKCNWYRIGKLVYVAMDISFPSTASGAQVSIGGLPFNVGATQTDNMQGLQVNGTNATARNNWVLNRTTKNVLSLDNSNAGILNSALSAKFVALSGAYLTDDP